MLLKTVKSESSFISIPRTRVGSVKIVTPSWKWFFGTGYWLPLRLLHTSFWFVSHRTFGWAIISSIKASKAVLRGSSLCTEHHLSYKADFGYEKSRWLLLSLSVRWMASDKKGRSCQHLHWDSWYWNYCPVYSWHWHWPIWHLWDYAIEWCSSHSCR